jgi:HlyD family secretion protein
MTDRAQHESDHADELASHPDEVPPLATPDPEGEHEPEARKPEQPDRDVIELAPAKPDATESEEHARTDGDRKTGNGKRQPGSTEGEDAPKPPGKGVFIVAGLLLLALVAWGGYRHWRTYDDSRQTTETTADRPVELRTAAAVLLDKPIDLTLPGETQALDTANILPRATGYIDQRRVDIGSRVKKGDLLVHIAAPDLDQQLAQAEAQIGQTRAALVQAKAQVAQAEANVNLAQVNLARTQTLTQQGYETQQNRDQQTANAQTQQANVASAKAGVEVAEANIKAQQATIDRLKALTGFENVTAPFDGVVTARNVDVGELVNADTTSATPMFTLVRDAVIRTIVRVPQSISAGIAEGIEARIVAPQNPDHVFRGTVQRSSVALLYASRTLTTEVDVPNESGALRPGLYVTVTFAVPRTHPDVSIPAEALIFDQHGVRVATVENGIVKMHTVTIARDLGKTLELRDGVEGGARVVLNVPATLKDGAKVKEIREEDEKKQDADDKAKNTAQAQGKPASDNQSGGT